MPRILALSLRFLVLYAVFQSLVAFTPLKELAGRLVGPLGAQMLAVCSGKDISWRYEDGKIVIMATVQLAGRPVRASAKLGALWYTRNIPMFIALVLAAAGSLRGRLVLLLSIGSLAVIFLDGVIVASHAWSSMSKGLPYTPAGYVLSIFGTWTLGGFSVAPLFIAALIVWGLHDGEEEPVRRAHTAPNAPCPCGSGLKYKRCCGKAAADAGA